MSDRLDPLSTLWKVAGAVLILGMVLAVIGLIVGGPDQSRRDSLHTEIDRAERGVETAKTDLQSSTSEGTAYAEGAQAILSEGSQFCGCSRRLRDASDGISVALHQVTANPNPVTVANYEQATIRGQPVYEEFIESLDRLRSLHSELPGPPSQ